MNYEGIVIRPPSEADSLIFQVTLGCSDNNCVFCPAYKNKKFKIKQTEKIFEEIDYASARFPAARKIFLADGDALIAPQEQLVKILDRLLLKFGRLRRVSMYVSGKSLETKSVSELRELKKRKMSMAYIGFETGDEQVYKMIKKYGSPRVNINAAKKLKEAEIKTNVTVITGLGGKKYSRAHALNTAKILNAAKPDQIAALTLMVDKSAPLYAMIEKGDFDTLDNFQSLEELKLLIENLENFPCLFFSNHASNYVPLEMRFPKDKEYGLRLLENILKRKDKNDLKPDFMRGL